MRAQPGHGNWRALWHRRRHDRRGWRAERGLRARLDRSAHTADEWLSLDELSAASEVLYRFLVSAT